VLERGWTKDADSWLNHWRIEDEVTLQNIDTFKSTLKTKFKEKLWCIEEMRNKRNLAYHKEIINPVLKDQNYLSTVASLKGKINATKRRTNSHELHNETRLGKNLKQEKKIIVSTILRK